jgi:hypothetical protein
MAATARSTQALRPSQPPIEERADVFLRQCRGVDRRRFIGHLRGRAAVPAARCAIGSCR